MPHVSPTLRAGGNKTGGDRPPGTDVDTADSLIPVLAPSVVGTLRTRRPGEGGVQGDFDHIVPVLSPALNTQSGSHHAPDTKAYVVTHPSLCADVAGPLTAKGPTALGAPEVDGNHYIASTVPIAFGGQMPQPMTATNMSLTLQAKNPQAVAYAIQERAVSLNLEAGPQGSGFRDDNTAYTLEARNKVQAVVFDTTQITSPQNYSNPQPGDPCHPLAAGAHPPTVAYDPIAFSAKDYGGDAGSISPTLRSGSHAGSHANGGVMPAVTYPINTQMALRKIDVATFGDTARTLSARHDGSPCADRGPDVVAVANGGVMPAVAYGFQPRIARNGRGDMGDVVSALSAQSGETGKGDAAPCVAIGVDVYNGIVTGETAATLGANSGNSNTSGPKVMARSGETDKGDAAPCEAFQQTADCLTSAYSTKWNGNASATNGSLFAGNNWAVRRLTPVECERLQGFPDGFTDIPWRKKPVGDCPDGPRYKALGNSMAVPVMRWIGERIQLVDDLLSLI